MVFTTFVKFSTIISSNRSSVLLSQLLYHGLKLYVYLATGRFPIPPYCSIYFYFNLFSLFIISDSFVMFSNLLIFSFAPYDLHVTPIQCIYISDIAFFISSSEFYFVFTSSVFNMLHLSSTFMTTCNVVIKTVLIIPAY